MAAFVGTVAIGMLACIGIARVVVPPRTNVVSAVARWELQREEATRRRQELTSRRWSARVAERGATVASRRGIDLMPLRRDLAICGKTLEDLVVSATTLTVVCLLAPTVVTAVLASAGADPGLGISVFGGLLLAVVGLALSVLEVRKAAKERRAELRRGLSMYLNLVAMAMEAGRAYEEALPSAARVGHGWVFDDLTDTVRRARVSGVPIWRGYVDLGERYGVVELIDLGQSLALALREGASVRSTLQARATDMRSKRLDAAETRANEASSSMSLILLMVGVLFVAYNLYPGLVGL